MEKTTVVHKFKVAQESYYEQALQEVKSGRKKTHWMWYIFPQILGLGQTSVSIYYSLDGLEEAIEFLSDTTLRSHLQEITQALLDLQESDIENVLGEIDAMKLRSSMTLFSMAEPENPIFDNVLLKYYGGSKDPLTLRILREHYHVHDMQYEIKK